MNAQPKEIDMSEQTSLAVAEPQRENAVVPMTESAEILSIIARAASNPAVDVDKMDRLLAMHERVRATDAKRAYFEAMSEMQDKLPAIQERGEIKIGGNNSPGQKYALWEDINRAIKPVLKEHGFALSFRTGQADGKITVTGVLSHKLGHAEETTIHLPSDTSGSKNAVQAVGSSTSYGKRYTAAALLNLTSTGDDDDGNAAGGNGPISDEEVEKIKELLERDDMDIEKFCAFMGVEYIAQIKKSDYRKAVTAINEASLAKAAKKKAAAK